MDQLLGTILMTAFDFAPYGWLLCNGQILNINEYQALFVLLGNKYGGDGDKTFALPDLRGRMPLGWGEDPNQNFLEMGKADTLCGPTRLQFPVGQPSHPPAHFLTINYIIAVQGNFPNRP